jgi:ABC-type multidrug transport system ATPase subunit
MGLVQQFCDRAMLIKSGKVAYIGNTAKVSSMYREENNPEEETAKHQGNGSIANARVKVSAELKNKPSDKDLDFVIKIIPRETIENAVIALSITEEAGGIVYRWASDEKTAKSSSIKMDEEINIAMKVQNIFPNGKFALNLSLRNTDMTTFYVSADELIKFEIINTSSYPADAYWKPNEEIKIS